MQKIKKEEVKNKLEEILKEEAKNINYIIDILEQTKKEGREYYSQYEKLSEAKKYLEAKNIYNNYLDIVNIKKYLEKHINYNLLEKLNYKILVVFFESVKNERDKSDFLKIINEDLKNYNISCSIYKDEKTFKIYFTKYNQNYNDYYSYGEYISYKFMDGNYKDYHFIYNNFEEAKLFYIEALKKHEEEKTKKINNLEELKKEYLKVKELKEKQEEEVNNLLNKHKEEMNKIDILRLLLFIK